MKKLAILTAVCGLIIATGCTDAERTKLYGGTMNITVPPGQKFIEATWKETSVWYTTRPMRADEKPEIFSFREKSPHGVYEGMIVFTESR